MNLSFAYSLMIFLMFCFPLFYTPVGMVGVLMALSVGLVGLFSFFGSFWYSYILFLIYVGGLLVLLIYICLISSNSPMTLSPESVLVAGIISLSVLSSFSWHQPSKFLGQSGWEGGASLVYSGNISILLFLVCLLLGMLLVVVRVSNAGSAISVNEKF